MRLPRLLAVPPPMIETIDYKVSLLGIQRMKYSEVKDGIESTGYIAMKRRYHGMKGSVVDINGKFWLNAADLKRSMKSDDKDKKKGRTLKRPTDKKLMLFEDSKVPEIIDTTEKELTIGNELSTEKTGLSTQRRVKENRINKREVRNRILGMINSSKGKLELYFWTVTFPQGTADDTAFKIYNIWLTSLRRFKMLRNYIWVAERQENNTIHFHIAIPHKMNVQRANAMMQGTLKTFAMRKEIPFHPAQCKRYNGVDIAKNRNTKRVTNFAIKKGSKALVTYLTKYIAKNDASFPHLAWHNSRGYSNVCTSIGLTEKEFDRLDLLPLLHQLKAYENKFAVFIPWDNGPPPWLTDHLYQLNSYVQEKMYKN